MQELNQENLPRGVKNLLGFKYEMLEVVSFIGVRKQDEQHSRSFWKCRCDCGEFVELPSSSIGKNKSCGCLNHRLTHNLWGTPIYKTWHMMKQRCDNPNHDSYPAYGGRGITYDPKWKTFEGFIEDMVERPEGTTLDRKDVNGSYCKENCHWTNHNQQAYNKNMQANNTSGKTGVRKDNRNSSWIATIQVKGKGIHLGSFPSFELARKAREAAEIKYYGKLKGN